MRMQAGSKRREERRAMAARDVPLLPSITEVLGVSKDHFKHLACPQGEPGDDASGEVLQILREMAHDKKRRKRE
jgi:hypothetical protein